MSQLIQYSNFSKYRISNDAVTSIDMKIRSFVNGQRIHCHVFDELTNSSMSTINSRSNDVTKPIKCLMTLYVIINGYESVRTYDLSNFISPNINFYIDIMNVKDIDGKSLINESSVSTTMLKYNNCNFSFILQEIIKFKSDVLSFYVKPTINLEVGVDEPVITDLMEILSISNNIFFDRHELGDDESFYACFSPDNGINWITKKLVEPDTDDVHPHLRWIDDGENTYVYDDDQLPYYNGLYRFENEDNIVLSNTFEHTTSEHILPYIAYYIDDYGNDIDLAVIHFNMLMPAVGLFELEESYDNGETWTRLNWFASEDYNGVNAENAQKLNGFSIINGCTNSLNGRIYQINQLIRVSQDGEVISQESFDTSI